MNKLKTVHLFLLGCVVSISFGQNETVDPTDAMVQKLSELQVQFHNKDNLYCPEAKVKYYDSLASASTNKWDSVNANYKTAISLLDIGKEKEAVAVLEEVRSKVKETNPFYNTIIRSLALAYMRFGERENCVNAHGTESCILPFRGNGIHQLTEGSSKAIELYEYLLANNPKDYEAMWVLNIAYMTLGKYPVNVPKEWLIPDLDINDTLHQLKPFVDVAANIGFNYRNCAGGLVVEDFNNDGYFDIITSDWNLTGHMHYMQNDRKGGFKDISESSNLEKLSGGLNMVHADYDNDGDNDILVLRGGWMEGYGEQPNSLLRNNGDDTFTDVTKASGLYSESPTQTAVWRDFNNDGWLDLFIGNESYKKNYPCQLYISNKNGTFTESAALALCDIKAFVKGVNAADYDNDGLQDIIISSFQGRILLKNMGVNGNDIPVFRRMNVGLNDEDNKETFATWFFDYDNDGWKDVFVAGYDYEGSMANNSAKDALDLEHKGSTLYLYHNEGDGTFKNITVQARLNKAIYPMGCNYGDIDNDGFLDMYLGTGNPSFSSLLPNKLFRNMGDGTFADVTVSARVGNLQKGHGIAILDMDNDGDQDILEEVGGAYTGDAFMNAFYLNPGQNENNWISISLQGTESNRSAIGATIKLTVKEKDKSRIICREVNSGASFGSASFRRDIGIGSAKKITLMEITWPSGHKQSFKNIKAKAFIKIIEGNNELEVVEVKPLDYTINSLEDGRQHCK